MLCIWKLITVIDEAGEEREEDKQRNIVEERERERESGSACCPRQIHFITCDYTSGSEQENGAGEGEGKGGGGRWVGPLPSSIIVTLGAGKEEELFDADVDFWQQSAETNPFNE